MNLSAVHVLERASELGVKLGVELPDTLTFQPVNRCPPEFVETLRAHKPDLLVLLRLPFVMVYSEVLEENVFFCEGEQTGEALIEASADRDAIYTRSELEILLAHNRARPFIPTELIKLHAVKKKFGAKLHA